MKYEEKKLHPKLRPLFAVSAAAAVVLGVFTYVEKDSLLIKTGEAGMLPVMYPLTWFGASDLAKSKALSKASYNGNTATVSALIDLGADVNASFGAALRMASISGHTKTVSLLLDRKADIHADFDAAIVWASMEKGHTATVRLLLERGANAQAQDNGPLHFAIVDNDDELKRLLLDHGANERIAREAWARSMPGVTSRTPQPASPI